MLNLINPLLALQTSLWPLLIALNLFSVFRTFVFWMSLKLRLIIVMIVIRRLLLVCYLWWKNIRIESYLGFHTHKLEMRIRIGIMFFILSEIFFFISFFWAFYDASLSPTVELGIVWPPKGIIPLSVYSVPLLNTIILLSRGITVTWAHHAIINNYFNKSVFRLLFTIVLGVYFLVMQWIEYEEAQFSIADGIYGRTFFMATGFHGMHVFVGTRFLIYVFYNLLIGKLLYNHHFSFEAAAWYWHFVDVVWLILFISIYWWGRL